MDHAQALGPIPRGVSRVGDIRTEVGQGTGAWMLTAITQDACLPGRARRVLVSSMASISSRPGVGRKAREV